VKVFALIFILTGAVHAQDVGWHLYEASTSNVVSSFIAPSNEVSGVTSNFLLVSVELREYEANLSSDVLRARLRAGGQWSRKGREARVEAELIRRARRQARATKEFDESAFLQAVMPDLLANTRRRTGETAAQVRARWRQRLQATP